VTEGTDTRKSNETKNSDPLAKILSKLQSLIS
jgi:hypothetical protein